MGLQLSGSIQLEGNLLVTGSANNVFENVLVSGKLTAQEIETQLVSSSIIYSSGSNKFGDLVTDTQQFTGSVDVSGSLSVNGNLQATTLVRTGGISTQFLKADGSVDSNSYALTSSLDNYLLLTGGTLSGALNGTSAVFSGTGAFTGNFAIGESVRTTSTLVINNTNAKNELTFGGSEFTNIYSETTSGLQFGITTTGNNAAIEFLTNNQTCLTLASTGAATFSSSVTAGGGSLFSATNSLTSNILTVRGGGASGAFGFRVEAANGEAIFRTSNLSYNILMCENGGNVGIGTTAPSAKLEVRDGSGVNLRVRNNGSNNLLLQNFNDSDFYRNIQVAASTIQLLTGTEGGGDATERLRITSTGNVGIGTTAPGSKLSIVGLPTSSAGLSAGDIFNDNGTLKIV